MEGKYMLLFSLSLILLTTKGQGKIICAQYATVVKVSESEPLNTVVFTPSCNETNGGSLTYDLVDGAPKPTYFKKFKMDSGVVKIKNSLNADFIFKFYLDIEVTNNFGESVVMKFGVKVVNSNDNSPVIKDLPSILSIGEDKPLGSKVATCNVKDKDKEDLYRVSILNPTPQDNVWYIDQNNCDLYLNGKLDYETKTSYTLTIQAVDTGDPPRNSNPQTLVINVVDVNDNYPVCPDYYKVVSLPEDHNVGVKIDGIVCTDDDSGTNGVVKYSLSASNDANTMSKFQVNATTGDLSLKTKVDYETLKAYEVKVDVADSATVSPLTSTVVYGIVVSDVDDNIPTWPVDPILIDVSEVSPLGNIVFILSADDADRANTDASKIKYEMLTPPNPDWFQIDQGTGAISVKDIMNKLTAAWVTMDVKAYSDKSQGFKKVTVNVTIIDENNVAPTFEEVFYQGNLTENDIVGTYILTVSAVDPEDDINGEIEYYLNSTIFQVDPLSGDVTLKTSVDFETDTVYSLKIEGRDKGSPSQSGFAFLLINVNPVNEFDPSIIGPTSPIEILEDTEPGTELFDFDAVDMDGGTDGFVTFSIQTSLSPFIIDPNSGSFRVASPLDREQKSSWEIIIAATDSSETNPRSSTTIVTINLGDINDNTPICNPLSTTTVPLAHTLNTQLATIQCTDADVGSNGEFTFTKLSGDVKGAFGVDASSGSITLLKTPSSNSYTLSIQIQDKGDPQLGVVIAYNIIAEIQFNFTQLPTTINVAESTLPNEELIDIDTCCTQGIVNYVIVSGNEDGHVVLDPSSGKLILRSMFDYETRQSFSYRIRGLISSTNTQIEDVLNVNIEDSNDNSPKFTTSFQETSVLENTPSSTSILNVKATDIDEGTNGEIEYSITGGNEFGIDSLGTLEVISALDAETKSKYTLKIIATDKGVVPRSSTATVFINVKNYNEFSPQIINMINGVVVANVSEDSTLGSPIFKIEAEDKDINTILTYTITAGNTNNAFVIDDSTGEVFLATILDRETTPQYNITVDVNNQNNENISALVVVNILDINDNDPKFNQDVYQLEVTHDDPANSLLKTFDIGDADSGDNANIASITIIDGDPDNHFKTDGTKLLTNVQINYYTDKSYSLILEATDGGTTPRSGSARVNIKVLPKFKSPKFVSNTDSREVSEDVVPSDAIYDMDATSEGATEGVTGTLTYLIQSGDPDNDFVISGITGVISIASEIDFERKMSYELIILAKSKEDPLLTSTSTLTLSIQNLNDNRPIFNKSLYDFNINENAGTGDFVGKVMATDADEAPFNSFTYNLGSASGSTDFIIDNAGNIKVDNLLSFISQRFYSIPVIADDGAHQTYSLMIIRINDINDHPPTFTPSSVSVDVVESVGIGNIFYTVKAWDLDTGIYGEIKYSLVSGNFGNQLSLDPDSGALTVASNLDREARDRFDLVIRAEDKGSPSALSGTLSLTVNVADVNDLNPTFTSSMEAVTINRSAAPGTTVLAKTATDGDLGDNAEIFYEITSGNDDGIFLIDTSNGLIKTDADVSAAKNEYTLVITAKDKGIPPRSGTLTVNVQIIPRLSSTPSSVPMQIKEELNSGEQVGFVPPTHTATLAINYQILSGNFKNSFNINPSTGEVTTARKLDREEYKKYILTVHVTDAGSVDYTQLVVVEVLDINDNDPVIMTTNNNINVVENTPVGQTVAGFTHNDPDDGDNGLIDLQISTIPLAASIHFQTDGNLLKIKKTLDYESTKSITFQILALDRGSPQRTGSIEVTINIIDVDDDIVYIEGSDTPSVYISRETSFYADDGEIVTAVTPAEYNMDPNIGAVSFKSLNREGIFTVAEDGVVRVQKRGLLEPEKKYFVWIVATAENGSDQKNILGLLRIDTFHPNKHLVSLESTSDVTALEANRAELTQKLNTMFPNDQPKIWKIQEHGGTSRRKLLAESSETLVYVIEGQPPDDNSFVEAIKTYKDVKSLLDTLRAESGQDTPKSTLSSTNYPVTAVNAHSEVIVEAEDETEDSFLASKEGIATIVALCLFLLFIIIVIIVVIICKRKRVNESSKELKPTGSNSVSPSRPTTPSQIIIADKKSAEPNKSGIRLLSISPKKVSTTSSTSDISNDAVDTKPVIIPNADVLTGDRRNRFSDLALNKDKRERQSLQLKYQRHTFGGKR